MSDKQMVSHYLQRRALNAACVSLNNLFLYVSEKLLGSAFFPFFA